jgi:hypothetical protein
VAKKFRHPYTNQLEKSLIYVRVDRAAGSMWMMEFSANNIVQACVTLGFCNSVYTVLLYRSCNFLRENEKSDAFAIVLFLCCQYTVLKKPSVAQTKPVRDRKFRHPHRSSSLFYVDEGFFRSIYGDDKIFCHPQRAADKTCEVCHPHTVDPAACSMLMRDFSDQSMWMTKFSVTHMFGACVTLSFCEVSECTWLTQCV